jgi:hypothetical protein
MLTLEGIQPDVSFYAASESFDPSMYVNKSPTFMRRVPTLYMIGPFNPRTHQKETNKPIFAGVLHFHFNSLS